MLFMIIIYNYECIYVFCCEKFFKNYPFDLFCFTWSKCFLMCCQFELPRYVVFLVKCVLLF